MNIIRTEIVWDILKKNDRVLIILPNILHYTNITNPYILEKFQVTLREIFKTPCKYIVAYIPNLIVSEEDLRKYEEFYQYEFQWLEKVTILKNKLFLEHYNPKKLYLLQKPFEESELKTYFSKAIIDCCSYKHTLPITTHHGKCYLEEVITSSFYLNKLLSRINNSLSMHQDDTSYDIALFIGNLPDKYPIQDLKDLIAELIKCNQCSYLYSLNQDINDSMKEYKQLSFKTIYPVFYRTEHLIACNRDVAHRFSTSIFIGSFGMTEPELWKKYISTHQHDCLFDPHAFDALINKENQKSFKVCLDPIALVKNFLA